MDHRSKLSARARAAESSLIDDLFRRIQSDPDVVSFAAGAPDPAVLPVELLATLTAGAVGSYGRAVLQYGLTQGFPPLREAVLPLLARRGVTCSGAEVHVSTGGSGALNNVCMALLDGGDTVVVERPTYSPAVKVISAYEARVVDVESDRYGMCPARLDDVLAAQPVKFVYLLPTFQNPTGHTMPADRRDAIAAVASRHDVLVVEDDVYYDLRYRGADVPALYSYAPERSVYLGSVSKVLAPAMRTGFAVMPPDVLDKVLLLKQGIDMQTSSFTQALVTEFLAGGHADDHLAGLRAVYDRRLRTLDAALREHMPAGFRWDLPEGGMFLWVTGPDGFDAGALLERAVGAGVAYLPGNTFHVDEGQGRNTMRLSFANPPEDRIDEGARRLAAVVAGGSR